MSKPKTTKSMSAKKPRNWLAVHAHHRSGAGSHGDRRKENSRRACRGRVSAD